MREEDFGAPFLRESEKIAREALEKFFGVFCEKNVLRRNVFYPQYPAGVFLNILLKLEGNRF